MTQPARQSYVKPTVATYLKAVMSFLVPIALAVYAVLPNDHHIDAAQGFTIVLTALGALVVLIIPNTQILALAKTVVQTLILAVVAAQQLFQTTGHLGLHEVISILISAIGAILVWYVKNQNYRTVNASAPNAA